MPEIYEHVGNGLLIMHGFGLLTRPDGRIEPVEYAGNVPLDTSDSMKHRRVNLEASMRVFREKAERTKDWNGPFRTIEWVNADDPRLDAA